MAGMNFTKFMHSYITTSKSVSSRFTDGHLFFVRIAYDLIGIITRNDEA